MSGRCSLHLLATIATLAATPAAGGGQSVDSLGLSLDSLLATPVSTVSKYEQRQSDAPASVSIVTADDIARFGYRTLDEVLEMQVGFYVGNDREHTDVGFRGFGRPGQYNNKILLLVDGHTVNDNLSGGTRIGQALGIDLGTVERVEIVRGPGSSLYGARAMLAVVNLVTRKGRDLDGGALTATVGTMGSYGASLHYGTVFGTQSDLALSASWGESDGEDLHFPEFDTPATNRGRAEGLDWERYARTMATYRKGGFRLQSAMGTRSKGIPTGAFQTTFNHPDTHSRDRIMFLEARFDRPLGAGAELTLRGYGDANENRGEFPYGPPDGPDRGGSTVLSIVEVRSLGGEGRLRWDPTSTHRVVAGLETTWVFHARQELTGSPAIETPYTIFSAFLHDELQLTPDLSLTLGLRRDQYSTVGSATTPRGALVYHPRSATTFKLLAGEAFRAPNLLETHPTLKTIGLIANPGLEPERVRTLEIVWEQRLPVLATTVSLFHNSLNGLIEMARIVPPDSLSDFGPLAFQYQNIQNARSAGIDVEVRSQLGFGLRTQVGYSLQHTRDDATGAGLINASRHQLRVSVSKSLPANSMLGMGLRAESGRMTSFGAETHGAAILNTSLTSEALPGGLRLTVIARNLLDTRYHTPGGFQHIQNTLPQPARRITVGLTLNW